MERLTHKNYIEEYEVNFEKSSNKSWSIAESDTHIKVTGEPVNKLGELEDLLEKYDIETTEELDGVLKPLIDNGELENWKSAIFWKMQTERLKQELAELKQSQKQLAISELEKLKVKLHIIHTNGYLKAIDEEIDDQIASLKKEGK